MKFNKWTLGLAAVGAVSMASAVRADEAKMSALQTAFSNTTISGVVDVGAQYNTGNVHNGFFEDEDFGGNFNPKLDAFSVNQVIISLDKPLDESPWAAGYHVDLNWGTDAVGTQTSPLLENGVPDDAGFFGTQSPVRQAYVTMRTPIGNGIDWKAGLFDNIIGYEGNTLAANPNYTHSFGWGLEPTSQLGLVGTYKVCNLVTVQAGLANSYGGVFDEENNVSDKTFLGAVTLTAPDSWGWVKGAALTVGVNQQFYKFGMDNYYAGLTLPTPISALKVGFALDVASTANAGPGNPHNDSVWVAGAYAAFQATDKLSLNGRAEYADGGLDIGRGEEVTLTAQYNLWANVISRVEVRWDHADQGQGLGFVGPDSDQRFNDDEDFDGEDGARSDDFMLAFNVAYQF